MKDTNKAREFYESCGYGICHDGDDYLVTDRLFDLMQDFSNQQNAELIAENERLKRELGEAKLWVELTKGSEVYAIIEKNSLQSRYDSLVEGLKGLQRYVLVKYDGVMEPMEAGGYVEWLDVSQIIFDFENPEQDGKG